MLRPFRQAVDFQLRRIPTTFDGLDELSDAARARAWWIAGLEKKALVEEAFGVIRQAASEGLTRQEMLDRIGDILDRGGTFLPAQRLELIAQNNLAASYAAGRYAQMNDPDITSQRPYRQYPLEPHDDHTTEICLELEGLVARYDDPIWEHITPPNHHGERHLQVLTLTEEQAKDQKDKLYATAGDMKYPVVGGRTILPNPGFDYAPGLLNADDRAFAEMADAIGEEVPASAAADYALELLSLVDTAALPELPELLEQIADASDAEEIDAAWESFRELFEIGEDDDATFIADSLDDGVRISREMFDRLAQGGDALANAPLIKEAIENPFEVWAIEAVRGDATVFYKRYIALFAGDDGPLAMVVDVSPEGVPMKSAVMSVEDAERKREGRLITTRSKKVQ